MLLRVTHGVAQAREFHKQVLLNALLMKAIDFQNQSMEDAEAFQHTVDSHAGILGEELTNCFQDWHNSWMTFLGVWAEDPAGSEARKAHTELAACGESPAVAS